MSLGLLVIRLAIGLTLASHGAQKLAGWFGGHGVHATGGAMERMGFRPGRRAAEMAGAAEVAGGLGLALGLLTPLAAAMVIGVMAVAGVAGHGGKGFFAAKGGWEYTFVIGCVAAGLAFAGAGHLSFDAALGLHLGGVLWGLFALALGLGAAFAQLAARHQEVDLTDTGGSRADSVPAAAPEGHVDHEPTRPLPSEADERAEAARRAEAAAEARRLESDR